jgi:hypothetical protein
MAVAEKNKIKYTGFIAQEVEKAANEVGYDFSGVDKPKNEKSLYGLSYSEFVVPLVKGMQEQQKMIEQQQQTIDDLKKQNSDVMNRISELQQQIISLQKNNK